MKRYYLFNETRNALEGKTMNQATKAQQDECFRRFALRVCEFSRCKSYDFADGSFLIVHDNGRTEVNAITF